MFDTQNLIDLGSAVSETKGVLVDLIPDVQADGSFILQGLSDED